MFVEDYMTPHPETVTEDALLSTVQTLLHGQGIHQVPVVGQGDVLVGIITDRDVRSAVGYDETLTERLRVAEVMSANPTTISVGASLDEALQVFCTRRFGALPVVEGERLVGIITRHDILSAFNAILGLDEPGSRVEIALPNAKEDLADAFCTLKDGSGKLISAIVSGMRRDGGEPALYLRVSNEDPREVERQLRRAGLIVLVPE